MFKTYVGLASISAIAVFTGWPLFNGVRTGTVYRRRVGYSRAKEPSTFWFFIVGYAAAFAASAGWLVFMAFEVMSAA